MADVTASPHPAQQRAPADEPVSSRLPLLPLVLGVAPAIVPSLLNQAGVPCVRLAAGAPRGRFVLFDSRLARRPALAAGQVLIDLAAVCDGFDQDPLAELSIESSRPHRFQVGRFELVEEIGCVDRRAIREAFLERLAQAIESTGGIWLRIAPFPYPYRAAFNLRLDHDACDHGDLAATLKAIRGREHAVSHYVCGSAFAREPAALMQLAGHDVGGHGYWHHTYRDREENRINIARGLELLERQGFHPRGFVAPHGRWNRGLASVLETLGIDYSSEFALATDDVPFWPAGSRVLQIPVHPVCLGLFLDVAERTRNKSTYPDGLSPTAAAEAASRYLQAIVCEKIDAGEPAFIYGHPDGRLGKYPRILYELFAMLDAWDDVWETTLGGFAAWWRRRRGAQLVVHGVGPSEIEIQATGLPADETLAIDVYDHGLVARSPLDRPTTHVRLESLDYAAPPATLPRRGEPLEIPFSWRRLVKREIDWEKVTPVSQIGDRSWRGWTKWLLRRLQSRRSAA